ncbi:hypothetical protein M6B38_320205 [Iris pallida]|uniref:Uncharacterized protein n=1 Tax=Iris pallida TaxID=29817 RepID=A0AAX6HB63_IRIPA|nr:hypothetical protein M6B38_320205 [Iris pallida]
MDMAHFEPTIRPLLVSHLLESPCATYLLMIINVYFFNSIIASCPILTQSGSTESSPALCCPPS